MKKWIPIASGLLAGFVAATISFADFSTKTNTEAASSTKSDAEKVYVPFGQKDDYYLFASGGHSGQMFIYGVPSMRKIRTIPVFSQDSATGYGFDEHSKKMMGGCRTRSPSCAAPTLPRRMSPSTPRCSARGRVEGVTG